MGIYADEGITGTSTKKRDEFNRMIEDCRGGKIDRIITKSISRFARNTLDCLNYVRELKEFGIGVIFEKEGINTLEGSGEVMLTILSSLAQDESRSISENSKWGIRKRFEAGEHKMATKRFLGYDIGDDGKLIINPSQAKIIRRIYREYLAGKTSEQIKREFENKKVVNWNGKCKWQATTIDSILQNEKYKGDALLQKSYTQDFLSKKRIKNDGEVQMYYIAEDHDAIISPEIWQAAQLERERRKQFLEKFNLSMYANQPEIRPFASKVICGNCKKPYNRKGWKTKEGNTRVVWQCSERYKVKGVMGCSNRHIDEEILEKALVIAWNEIYTNRINYLKAWEEQIKNGNELESYTAEKFMEYSLEKPEKLSYEFILKTLSHIEIYENGSIIVNFLDGTEIELIND